MQGKVGMLEKQKEVLTSTLNNQCTISEKVVICLASDKWQALLACFLALLALSEMLSPS